LRALRAANPKVKVLFHSKTSLDTPMKYGPGYRILVSSQSTEKFAQMWDAVLSCSNDSITV
jgi:hypothetical protein